MISCTEFIPAYSELFAFLHALEGGAEGEPGRGVVRFWEHLSDVFLANLRDMAERDGLAGCFEYWSHTLAEEAADFRMTLDPEHGRFEIDMRRCPSKGRLLADPHLAPYPHYCRHCDTLYRRVLEPLGFTYEIDLSRVDEAACRLIVRERRPGGVSDPVESR